MTVEVIFEGVRYEVVPSSPGPRLRVKWPDQFCKECTKQFKANGYQASYCSPRCKDTHNKRAYRARKHNKPKEPR